MKLLQRITLCLTLSLISLSAFATINKVPGMGKQTFYAGPETGGSPVPALVNKFADFNGGILSVIINDPLGSLDLGGNINAVQLDGIGNYTSISITGVTRGFMLAGGRYHYWDDELPYGPVDALLVKDNGDGTVNLRIVEYDDSEPKDGSGRNTYEIQENVSPIPPEDFTITPTTGCWFAI